MAIQPEQIETAVKLAKKYGVTRLILFGSAAREPAKARDLDLACDGLSGWSLYEFGAQLEEMLQIPLDLVPLSPPNRFTKLIESHGEILL